MTNLHPYVWLDALAVKCREAGRIVNVACVVATGVAAAGRAAIRMTRTSHTPVDRTRPLVLVSPRAVSRDGTESRSSRLRSEDGGQEAASR
jgi:hypothetical protein